MRAQQSAARDRAACAGLLKCGSLEGQGGGSLAEGEGLGHDFAGEDGAAPFLGSARGAGVYDRGRRAGDHDLIVEMVDVRGDGGGGGLSLLGPHSGEWLGLRLDAGGLARGGASGSLGTAGGDSRAGAAGDVLRDWWRRDRGRRAGGGLIGLLAGAFLGAAAKLGELGLAPGREFALALGFGAVLLLGGGVTPGAEGFELPLLGMRMTMS